ncbi:glycosidase [Hyperthermus butylicus]|uniref:Universally conserved protein n=1 Tax=Hyperthermus butylicus (strain DSM 5456 / JCM 9403 / PLM1-5) TaxID=415426 RepID=A2BMQ4_HYPBU|nr:glycosidase [Hyperthermus butylicus]ABM81265.1 universally conserved protein [Hyperthermus butylicus DSM 5456]
MASGSNSFFPLAEGAAEAASARRPETRDIVRRLGVIPPERITITNYPVARPLAVFNAALSVEEDNARIYARIIMGYYLYISAIAEINIPLEDINDGSVGWRNYAAAIVVYPSTRYDVWGTEDPRVFRLDEKLYMVYTGRTVNYFRQGAERERTLPVAAVMEENGWTKKAVFVLPPGLRRHLISDKNAFLVRVGGDLLLFHRPHMDDNRFYLAVSKVEELPHTCSSGICEIEVRDTVWVLPQAPFETKIGWATPPVDVAGDTVIALAHGVDREIGVYRVFAVKLRYSRKRGITVESVTPTYIMEPREIYEVYGDRPYTIFPCGAWRVDRDTVLLTYGAGDYVVGIGSLNINELIDMLE